MIGVFLLCDTKILFNAHRIDELKANHNVAQSAILSGLVFDQLNLKSISDDIISGPFAKALCKHGILDISLKGPCMSLIYSKAKRLSILESLIRENPEAIRDAVIDICVSGTPSTIERFIQLCIDNYRTFTTSINLLSYLWTFPVSTTAVSRISFLLLQFEMGHFSLLWMNKPSNVMMLFIFYFFYIVHQRFGVSQKIL
jgi:hypothetical protein